MVIAQEPFCWKWISVTKISKYGQNEYSRALNTSYTFQPLMGFSLRASSPFGGYCEKYTRERHARGDATAGGGEENCNPYFTASQHINNLENKRSYKRKVNLKNLKFFKKSIEPFKNYSLICERGPKCSQTAKKNASIHTYQILLPSNRLELSPWSFRHGFEKVETTVRWNCMSKRFVFYR